MVLLKHSLLPKGLRGSQAPGPKMCTPSHVASYDRCVITRSADGEASPSGKDSAPNGLDAAVLGRVVKTVAATAVLYQFAYGMQAAKAEDRAWHPRRHFRRMDERFTSTWAEDLAEVRAA